MGQDQEDRLSAFGPSLHAVQPRPLVGRSGVAAALDAALDAGRSVLLVAPEGSGRRTLVQGVAQLRHAAGKGPLVEVRAWALDGGAGRGGHTVEALIHSLHTEDGVAFLPHGSALTRPLASGGDGTTLWEALEEDCRAGRARLVVRSSPADAARLLRAPGVAACFDVVELPPLSSAEVAEVVRLGTERLQLTVLASGLRAIVELATTFLTHRAMPGSAMELVARVADYHAQKVAVGEPEPIDATFVERVVAIYTGLPRAVIARAETWEPEVTRAWFEERLLGQPAAVAGLVEALGRFRRAGHDGQHTLGSLLFVGPPGVGRRTAARLLAEHAFGTAQRVVRVDLLDPGSPEGWTALAGDPEDADAPAPLADAIRRQPYNVLLLDGLEAAPDAVRNDLKVALETGELPTAEGEVLDLRSSFVIATTTEGSAWVIERLERLGRAPEGTPDVLTHAAREAFLVGDRRLPFDDVVPFTPLDVDPARELVHRELDVALREAGHRLPPGALVLEEEAVDVVLRVGFSPHKGVRNVGREVRRRLVLPLSTAMLEGPLSRGETIAITAREGHVRVRRSGVAPRALALADALPEDVPVADLVSALQLAAADLAALSVRVGEPGLREQAVQLKERNRTGPTADARTRAAEELDGIGRVLERVDHLRARLASLEADVDDPATRPQRVALHGRIVALRAHIADAVRELLVLGDDADAGALVEVRPLTGGAAARDLVVQAYARWATERGFDLRWLCEPLDDEDPAHLAIRGPFAYGLLRLEAGVHRRLAGPQVGDCCVRVGGWTGRKAPVSFVEERALKAVGAYGGRVRSRVECGGGLVLQNDGTLASNRDLALEVFGAWVSAPKSHDAVIRRYDVAADVLRDGVLGELPGPAALQAPGRLHELLCARVDTLGSGPTAA